MCASGSHVCTARSEAACTAKPLLTCRCNAGRTVLPTMNLCCFSWGIEYITHHNNNKSYIAASSSCARWGSANLKHMSTRLVIMLALPRVSAQPQQDRWTDTATQQNVQDNEQECELKRALAEQHTYYKFTATRKGMRSARGLLLTGFEAAHWHGSSRICSCRISTTVQAG